jgi:hypothetical protein
MFHSLSSLVSNVDDLLALEVEELAFARNESSDTQSNRFEGSGKNSRIGIADVGAEEVPQPCTRRGPREKQ